MKKLLFLYLAVCALAFSQGVRYDPVPVLTTASNVPPGAMAPVLAIGGAKIHVCGFPANAVPCTNYATTYTDVTLNTACANTAQITLPGTTQCVSSTDQQGNFGFWVNPGEFSYTVTIPTGQSYGPYPIMTINSGTQLSYLQGATGSVSRTVTNRLQDYMSVKDFGAKGDGTTDDTAAIQAALNAVCATGGRLYIPAGTYKVTATLATPAQCNGIALEGAGNVGVDGETSATLRWAGASGGTVLTVYASSWSSFSSFMIDGNNLAGQGMWFEAQTPGAGSNQKNIVRNVTIKNCTGSPGYGLAVHGAGGGDDVSQNLFDSMTLSGNNYNLFQDGTQTLMNIYENITSIAAVSHGFYFNGGDVTLKNNTFLVQTTGTSAQLDHVFIAPTAYYARLTNNYYECLASLNPANFSNYRFPAGAAPNRFFGTYIKGDKVQWTLVGGKVLDYEQQGPVTVEDVNSNDIFQPNRPGSWYFNSSLAGNTLEAYFKSSFLATTSQIVSIGTNVAAKSDNPTVPLVSNVFEGNDASISSSSAVLTIGGSHSFDSSMVGYFCYVQNYLSGNNAQQNKVTAFTSATQVTLSSAATNTASGLYYRCGKFINQAAGVAVASTNNVDQSTILSDSLNPRVQLRRSLNGTIPQNWAMRVSGGATRLSIMDSDNPTTANYSDFIDLIPNGTAASSVSFPVPIRIGGTATPLFGIFFQDFTGVNVGTIAAGSSFSTTVTLTAGTVTSGLDGCQAWGGISSAGIVAQCSILSSNQALITYANVNTTSTSVGTTTIRVMVIKFSYAGP